MNGSNSIAQREQNPVSILLIEANQLIRDKVAEGLRQLGYLVIAVATAGEAVASPEGDADSFIIFGDLFASDSEKGSH